MMNSNIIIRQAQSKDIESIVRIKVAGWQNAYKGIIDDEYLMSMSVSELFNAIKSYSLDTIFVVENEGEIIAFCRFYDYDKPVYEDEEIDCEIREIYVKPDMKRMCIGSNLFAHTTNYFQQKDKKKLYLGCFKDNHTARKFYEKMGGVAQVGKDLEIGEKHYPTVSYIYDLSK
ncbi:MAG: GNAT family N-acetyltransferase [Eubacterium sp.]|nr:GNAT family N-acetyltransferase [Eubacterium sp.]